MCHSAQFAKNAVLYGLFFLLTLFFAATVKAQVTGGSDLVIQPDGKILLYGNGSIARVDQNGVPDASFSYSSSTFSINSAVVQSNGKIIIAGSFPDPSSGFSGALVRRLNSNGTVDSTFTELYIPGTPSPSQSVATVWAVQADDKIVVSITTTAFGQYLYEVRRLNVNGGADITIQVSAGGIQSVSVITKVAVQPDGNILVITRPALSASTSLVRRYNQNGTVDSSFTSPGISSTVTSNYLNDIIAGAGGGIFIGGSFQKVNSVDRNNLAKLQAAGSLDTTFISPLGLGAVNNNSGDEVRRIAFAPNNQIIISTANRLIRLNSNGTIDTTFNPPNTITQINAFRVNSTGGIVFIGTVTVNGAATTKLWRLNADGSLDNSFTIRRAPYDFDGDGKSDITVFRPSNGVWYYLNNQNNSSAAVQFGQAGDRLAPADYDGDGKTDIAVFRSGIWYLQRSSLGFTGVQFGAADDIPVPGDYDGDGKADLAVFRESTGVWYLLQSQNGFTAVQFGQSGDKTVAADYDGDGKTDIAVVRPSNAAPNTAIWYLFRSQLGFTSVAAGTYSSFYKPIPADYDGDGKADVAFYDAGSWNLYRSQSGYNYVYFGISTDLPVPADYDGDGKADIAVFRPSDGVWYLNRSQAGSLALAFGTATDKPVPNAFVP